MQAGHDGDEERKPTPPTEDESAGEEDSTEDRDDGGGDMAARLDDAAPNRTTADSGRDRIDIMVVQDAEQGPDEPEDSLDAPTTVSDDDEPTLASVTVTTEASEETPEDPEDDGPQRPQTALQAQIQAMAKEMGKRKKNLKRVRVRDHPKYQEYIKFMDLGVNDKVLEDFMDEEGLTFEYLNDLDQKVEIDETSSEEEDENSLASFEEIALEERLKTPGTAQGRRTGMVLGRIAAEQGMEGEGAMAALDRMHHGGGGGEEEGPNAEDMMKKMQANNAENREADKLMADFGIDASDSDDTGSTSEEEEPPDDPDADKEIDNNSTHNFQDGSLMFKIERFYSAIQVMALIFEIEGIDWSREDSNGQKTISYFKAIFGWSTVFLRGWIELFMFILKILKLIFKATLGVDFFDLEMYGDVVRCVVSLVSSFAIARPHCIALWPHIRTCHAAAASPSLADLRSLLQWDSCSSFACNTTGSLRITRTQSTPMSGKGDTSIDGGARAWPTRSSGCSAVGESYSSLQFPCYSGMASTRILSPRST